MKDKVDFNTEGWTKQKEQNGQLARCKMSVKK